MTLEHSDSGDADVHATLDGWRAQGADRLDPVRFRFIEALARRSTGHSGAARRLLDERLAGLLAAYGGIVERATANPAGAEAVLPPTSRVRGELAALTDEMARLAAAKRARAAVGAAPYPELDVLDYFREVWSRVRTERQFRQSLEQVPGNAGPLNSSSLVHRSLALMREVSPGYLQQFLSYVDALSWLEQMSAGASPGKEAPRAASPRKGARAKAR